MLTLRDVVILGALIFLIMWWFKRRCGCGPRRDMPRPATTPAPAPPPRAPSSPARKVCNGGLAPCGGMH